MACAERYFKKAADLQAPLDRTSDNEAPLETRSVAEPLRKPCHVAFWILASTASSARTDRALEVDPSSKSLTLAAALLEPHFKITSLAAPRSAHGPQTALDVLQQHWRSACVILGYSSAFRLECYPRGPLHTPSSEISKASDCAREVKC